MNPYEKPFNTDNQNEALTEIIKLDPEPFEKFCDALLRQCGYNIETTTKRGGDGGVDARVKNENIAFHYTTAFDTESKENDDFDAEFEKNILMTNRHNRDAEKMDELWDAEALARKIHDQ